MDTKKDLSLLTPHVLQLLHVLVGISGVDVMPVTVTEVLQDVSGVEG